MGGGSGPNKGGGRGGGGSQYSGRNATRQSGAPRGGRGGGRGGAAGGPKRKENVAGGGNFGGGFNPTGPPAGGGGGPPAARGGHKGYGGIVSITSFQEDKAEKEDKNLQHVGAVAMESAHHDLLFGLIQEHKEELGDDYGEVDAEEAGKTERRLVKMGFSSKQVNEAMDAIGGCDFDAVLDHLVLHTPEHLLPNAFKEKKQPEPQPVVEAHRQQRQQPGSSSKVSAFLPQPIILKPGQKVWKADPSEVLQPPKLQGAASGGVVGVVKPLTGAEEKKVVNLVAFGFDRLQCIDALKKTVGDAQKALVHLLASLYPHADEGPAAGGFDIDEDEVEDMRFDERTAVESMYGEDAFKEVWFQIGHIVGCEVKLEVRGIKGPVRLLCRYDLPCQYPYRPPYLLVRSDGNGSISDSQALKSSHELCAHAAKLVKANPGVPVVFDLCTWLKERMEDDIREQRANSQKPQSSPPKPKQERPKKDQDHQVKKTPLAAVEAFCDKKLNNDHYQKMAANTQAKLSKAETLEKQLAEAREKAIEAGRIAREQAEAAKAREEAERARADKAGGKQAAGAGAPATKAGQKGKGHHQPGLSIVKPDGDSGEGMRAAADGSSSASEAETEEDILVKDIEKILTTKASAAASHVGGAAAVSSKNPDSKHRQRANGGLEGFTLADLSKGAAARTKIDTSVTEPKKGEAEVRREQADSAQMASVMEQNLRGNAAYIKMQALRSKLPAYGMAGEILAAINRHQVVVISGDTGCGKTTQLPQLVLDEAISQGRGGQVEMICTQPRRISAMSVAERVASERAEKVGHTVGYQIRLEAKRSAATKLLFCTTGVLLRRLQGDCLLKGVSHIFVDEIHERDINSDFLLIILKQLLPFRPSLKVILMSATLNAPMFADYFGDCPCVTIPGRAHPVQALFLEDAFEHTGYVLEKGSEYAKKEDKNSGSGSGGKGGGGGGGGARNHQGLVREQMSFESSLKSEESAAMEIKKKLPGYSKNTYMSLSRFSDDIVNYEIIVNLVEHICFTKGEGAILIFMSGLAEITKLYEELTDEYSPLGRDARIKIYPLHSTLSTAEQKAIFDPPPAGCRKVVIATNIAETSITIDDVVYVIDTCKMKENKWNAITKMSSLTEDWVSQASGRQRKGRAGRVKPGVCYHLVPSYVFNSFAEYQVPEMLRVPLDGLILQIKTLNMGDAAGVLGRAIEAPGESAIGSSMELLRQIGALDEANEDSLTPLGFHLATLPVDVRIGKMLIYGAIFGCIEPVLTMAAAMGFRSPFFSPIDKREEADKTRKALGVAHSDHLTTLKAMNGWIAAKQVGRREASNYCQDNFLSRQTLEMISEMRDQFKQLLASIGFVPDKYGNNKFDRRDRDSGAGPRPEPAAGAHVRAKFYGDNKYYAGSIVDACEGGGWSVIFEGFEDDGVQTTWPKDITVLACNRCGTAGHVAANCTQKLAGAANAKAQDDSNQNAENVPLLKAVITAGLYPNIIVVDASKKVPKLNTRNGEVFLHPACLDAQNEANLDSKMLVYHEMVKTAKVYVRDATTISPYALLLFGGAIKVQHKLGKITVDGWLGLDAAPKTAVLVKQMREHLDRMLLRKIDAPSEPMSDLDQRVISSIALLLETERTKEPGKDAAPQGTAASSIKPGDWPCPKCGNNVFASKRECNKCGFRK